MGSALADAPAVGRGLRELRAATAPYKNLDAAVAAGYPRTVADCIVDEHHGAMGYHHLNRAYVDGTLDPTKPEFLLYERMPDSSYRLNGVEFIVRGNHGMTHSAYIADPDGYGLEVLYNLLNAPSTDEICDQSPTAARKTKKLRKAGELGG